MKSIKLLKKGFIPRYVTIAAEDDSFTTDQFRKLQAGGEVDVGEIAAEFLIKRGYAEAAAKKFGSDDADTQKKVKSIAPAHDGGSEDSEGSDE